jgi:hypothetical protein
MPIPTRKKTKANSKKKKEWNWGESREKALATLKQLLTSAPILGYANSKLPYESHVDASENGLGAVLYQEQDHTKRVISYASRGLTMAE